MSYAIIETGGKQYRVAPGQTVRIEKLEAGEGDTVTFDKVLLVSKEENVKVGNPLLEGAKVTAKVAVQGKGPKIMVFKYKQKVNYRKRYGHRQPFTAVTIEAIEA